MNPETIALLELVTVGGIGAAVFVAGLLIFLFQKQKSRSCTASTVGQITKHKFFGEGRMAPVVAYRVDGKEYSVTRKFSGVITTQKIHPGHLYTASGAYVSEKDYLHVPMSAVSNLKQMACELWPIGNEMQVFYDPNHPQKAYAERLPKGLSFAAGMFIGSGIGVMLLSVLMYFVVR